ncbi:interleukin-27 subunit beta isoform X1 [Notothenia coriiceps]|uniref:Interleukin-27 subunit beta isoform X1 n=1 Tax=Notothenia coriiceps TaxID=8208 RepID=A0A6I9PZ12_9TELE|nr:PREDICTED: interleukin-27 subunit beta isoform X1 [Notothenia coriiceps]
MAAIAGRACVTVVLLLCVLGGQALDLLMGTTTPGNSPSIPTVRCRCASYPNVTLCSWPEPPHHPPTHYVATYSERHSQSVTKHCHLIQPGSSSSDVISASSSSSDRLWHCHMPSLKLLTDYIINVTAVYSGSSSFHLSSFMLEDIVKPDPPVDVTVSPRDSKRLLVQWSPPPTWAHLDIFPLKYQIKYQRESRGIPRSYNLGPIESNWVVLKLKPGAYLFQVCAKELLNLGECSDWSSPVKITIPRTK